MRVGDKVTIKEGSNCTLYGANWRYFRDLAEAGTVGIVREVEETTETSRAIFPDFTHLVRVEFEGGRSGGYWLDNTDLNS